MPFLDELRQLYAAEDLSTQADHLAVASRDESSLPPVTPQAVVWAHSSSQVAQTIQLCRRHQIAITTRGAGSALEGSTIPLPNGLVLDLSRMTGILNFWPEDLQVEVEPGIIYDHLNTSLKREGLFFPPSPGGSGDVATIGGMVSTNASGIYSVKYGGTREYILALEVVTGTGEILTLGNRAIKRSSGYNLVELVCGSEGTLGVITKITLKLAGIPEDRRQSAYKFPDEASAARAVSEMRRYGVDLAAVEFLDRRLLVALNQLKGYGLEEVPCLFLEFHGPTPVLDSNTETSAAICEEQGGRPLTLSDGHRPWEIRHWATDAVKHFKPGYSILRNDVAFPISKLPEMVAYCHELGDSHGVLIFTFGHVGLGLLHALMIADRNDTSHWAAAEQINDLIIQKTIQLGGTVSGEHGIGLGHKEHFRIEHGGAVDLMRQIKSQFDPDGIMNPGKVFDL